MTLVDLDIRDREEGGWTVFARNRHLVRVWIQVRFDSLVGLEPSQALPYRDSVPPTERWVELFDLIPQPGARQIGFAVAWTAAPGDPRTAFHDDDYVYTFPFAHGTKHRVTQGHNGDFTHFGSNQYALDFDLDTGTPIHTARDGVVIEVKEDSSRGGLGAAYSQDGNYVLIAHDDGSFGNYVHLRLNGAEVEVGQRVEVGQLIGYSGATGRASGPHLHFDVRLPQESGEMISIPVRFRHVTGEVVTPEEGRYYYAVHPGGPEFPWEFGADIVLEDVADHREPFTDGDTVDLRLETLDGTYLLFARNALDTEVSMEISVNSRGLQGSRQFPATVEVPPQTEIFVALFRPAPGANSWNLGYGYRYRRPQPAAQ